MSNAEPTAQPTKPGEWCGPDGCPVEICGGPHAQYMDDHENIITVRVSTPAEVAAYQEASRLPAFRRHMKPGVHQAFASILVALTSEMSDVEAFSFMKAQLKALRTEYYSQQQAANDGG